IPIAPLVWRRDHDYTVANVVGPLRCNLPMTYPAAVCSHDLLALSGHKKIRHQGGGIRMRRAGRDKDRNPWICPTERLGEVVIDGSTSLLLGNSLLVMTVDLHKEFPGCNQLGEQGWSPSHVELLLAKFCRQLRSFGFSVIVEQRRQPVKRFVIHGHFSRPLRVEQIVERSGCFFTVDELGVENENQRRGKYAV